MAAAFIQIIRTSDETEALVQAHTTARSAVAAIARDLRQLQLDPNPNFQQLFVIDRTLTYGDFVDNDGDGDVDEENFDARHDEASTWSPINDRHAFIGGFTERSTFVTVPDYGDGDVDEDTRFSADEVTFIKPPGSSGFGSPRQRITYRIGDFDGEENVLLRIIENNPSPASTGAGVVEPVAFDVVSLDILPWNPNNNNTNSPVPGAPYYETSWDAQSIGFPGVNPIGNTDGTVPPFKLPAAFLIRVVANAEKQPLSEIAGWPLTGESLKTVAMTTVVNVDEVLQDPRYEDWVRP